MDGWMIILRRENIFTPTEVRNALPAELGKFCQNLSHYASKMAAAGLDVCSNVRLTAVDLGGGDSRLSEVIFVRHRHRRGCTHDSLQLQSSLCRCRFDESPNSHFLLVIRQVKSLRNGYHPQRLWTLAMGNINSV